MVSKKVTARIRKFVCDELRGEVDLSALTFGILKKRYLALVGEDSLSPDARTYMKQVVEEELMKTPDNDEDEGEVESKKRQKKRKREEENDEDQSGNEDKDESTSKKPRDQLSSSLSESEDNEGHKSGSEDGDEEEEEEEEAKSGSENSEDEVEKPHGETNGINRKGQKKSEDSPEEHESGESESESPKEEEIKQEKEDEEDEGEDGEKINKDESSSDSENEEKVPVKTGNDSDSDSSSLPSLEDEQETATKKKDEKKNKKKKTTGKDHSKDDEKKNKKEEHRKDTDKQVVKLKRYISLCGATRNYKKLLEGCSSVHAMVAALKKELEDLGVQGRPTIKKCKRVKKKREEAQEIAELDVNNIITTQGRPKRRGASARHDAYDPPSSTYKRALNSGSESDEENKRPRRTTDWSNLQGIISDGADSD